MKYSQTKCHLNNMKTLQSIKIGGRDYTCISKRTSVEWQKTKTPTKPIKLVQFKSIIAVAFFGTLTYLCAPLALNNKNKCSKDKAMEDFDPAKFFNGTWYVSHEKNETSPNVCQKFNTKGMQGVTNIVESRNNNKDIAKVKQQCNGVKKNEDQQYTFECKSDECGSENSYFEFTVLFTDYVDYALISRCDTYGSDPNEDDLWILERNKPEGVADANAIC